MEANLVIKAADFTPDFADGIVKVFSKDAILRITIEYGESNVAATVTSSKKAKASEDVAAKPAKRPYRKSGVKATPQEKPVDHVPKKRGPKPKVVVED